MTNSQQTNAAGVAKQERQSQRGGDQSGDNRTPDKTIGEVKYADSQRADRDLPPQKQSAEQRRAEKSQMEGPAAYAPHQEDEDVRVNANRDPARKKTGEF